MDHLVVRQRQDEVLRERVDQGEREFTVVPTTVDRVFFHVTQGVVHPPHVPLQPVAKASSGRRRRNTWPRG